MVATIDREMPPATGILRLGPELAMREEDWLTGDEYYRPTSAAYIEDWLGMAITEEKPAHFHAFYRAYESAFQGLEPATNVFLLIGSPTTDRLSFQIELEFEGKPDEIALVPSAEKFSMTFNVQHVKRGRMLPVTDESAD
ncbi:MAG: hypothetical protein ACRDJH_09970 [Thermomicrobiales bacterium]